MNKIVVNEKKYVLDALNGTEKPDIGFYSFLNLISSFSSKIPGHSADAFLNNLLMRS